MAGALDERRHWHPCMKCKTPTPHAIYAVCLGLDGPPTQYVACCQECRPKPPRTAG